MNQMLQAEENNSGSNAGHDQLNQNKENEEMMSTSPPPVNQSNLTIASGGAALALGVCSEKKSTFTAEKEQLDSEMIDE
jgi:hypothetical protein